MNSVNNIKIRKAKIDDLYEIQKFDLEYNNFDSTLVQNWPLTQDGREYFEKAIKDAVSLIAYVNDEIVGYLVGTLYSQYSYNNNIQAELDNMCVMKEYRNQGIGQKLFEEFKKICKDNKVNEIKVVASYNNLNAINFYKKNCFEEAELTLKQKID